MHINILTLFPEWFESPLKAALIGRAVEKGLVSFSCINPRDEATDAHRSVDDRPYGGGPGMVMMLEPLAASLRKIQATRGTGRVIMLSASGKPLTQKFARELSKEECLTLICGRYEGIDGRLGDIFPLEEISVGEAVLNGGESAAMMLIEAATRLIPGFMGKEESGTEESFSDGLLEYPHFTRPDIFEGRAVPEVLRSGDHAKIADWRRRMSLEKTFAVRPDMLDSAPLQADNILYLRELAEKRKKIGTNVHVALLHYPVILEGKKVGATSLTNLDIHDICRCSQTYRVGSVQIVTPLEDQRHILDTLSAHWTTGQCALRHPDRAKALSLMHKASDLDEAIASVQTMCGETPLVIGTGARLAPVPYTTFGDIRAKLRDRPVLLVFGTGHGLAPEVFKRCDGTLRPIRCLEGYNHLSVRSAAAIILDRLLRDYL